jgi:SAM-dependent methyltransferase
VRAIVLLTSEHRFAAIEPVLAELDEARRALSPSGVDLHVVAVTPEPSSRLGTELARRLGLRFDTLTSDPRELESAVLRGLRHAIDDGADLVATLDADGQHDARQLPDLIRFHLARRSGMTIGSRWARGGSSPGTGTLRAAVSRLGNRVVVVATGARGVSDSTTSFRVYSPEVVSVLLDEQLPSDPVGCFAAMAPIVQAHGFGIDEVPIVFRPRYVDAAGVDGADLASFVTGLPSTRRRVRGIRRTMRHDQSIWAQRNPKLRAQQAVGESEFGATEELFALSDSHQFLEWIVDEIRPALGARVLEVGAGVGAIALRLAAEGREVTAIEPADNVFPELARRAAGIDGLTVLQITSQDYLASDRPKNFDTVVYVSVLEHILDDVAELRAAFELLRPGGRVAVFVPAMPSLYGSLDFKSGHYRRYDREMLRHVMEASGFAIDDLHHLDVAGVVPYFVMYRLLDVSTLGGGSSAVYDRLVVPVGRFIQRRIARPGFGKNLVAVGRRPPVSSRSV